MAAFPPMSDCREQTKCIECRLHEKTESALRDQIADLERRLAEGTAVSDEPCKWKRGEADYYWFSDCGLEWIFPDGTPEENYVRFCPGCGKPCSAALEADNE